MKPWKLQGHGPLTVSTLAALRLHLPFLQQQIWTSNTFGVIRTNMHPHSFIFRLLGQNESHLCRSGFGREAVRDTGFCMKIFARRNATLSTSRPAPKRFRKRGPHCLLAKKFSRSLTQFAHRKLKLLRFTALGRLRRSCWFFSFLSNA